MGRGDGLVVRFQDFGSNDPSSIRTQGFQLLFCTKETNMSVKEDGNGSLKNQEHFSSGKIGTHDARLASFQYLPAGSKLIAHFQRVT